MAELKFYISLRTLDCHKTQTNILRQLYWKFTEISAFLHNTKSKKSVSNSVMPYSLQPQGLQLARLLSPRDSPGKKTRVDCHAILQIFPTQDPGI